MPAAKKAPSQNARRSGSSARKAIPELERKHLTALEALKDQSYTPLNGSHQEAIEPVATLAAIVEESGRYFARNGLLDARGKPRAGALLYLRAHSKLMRSLASLGVTPESQTKMGVRLAAMKLAENAPPVQPKRDPEHVREVARTLFAIGALPRPKRAEDESTDVIDAEALPEAAPAKPKPRRTYR